MNLGNIDIGRPNLGDSVPVAVYRLFQYSMHQVMAQKYGAEEADNIFRLAGRDAGIYFAKSFLPDEKDFHIFVQKLQDALSQMKIGILRIEKADLVKGELILSVYEDLDCSGLPVTDETVCVYDEGFIAGVLFAHTGKEFFVREVDCWATGERVCRFKANVI